MSTVINAGSETRMDWLKNILHSLPLESISDILGEIAIWWGQMVKDVPPADLPMYAYLGGSILVLVLWFHVVLVGLLSKLRRVGGGRGGVGRDCAHLC